MKKNSFERVHLTNNVAHACDHTGADYLMTPFVNWIRPSK